MEEDRADIDRRPLRAQTQLMCHDSVRPSDARQRGRVNMTTRGEPGAGYRHSASVTVRDEAGVRELLRQPLDFGCKPSLTRLPDGSFAVAVIGTDAELRRLAGADRDVSIHPVPEIRAEVGGGDRFKGGRVVPRGLGRKEPAR
jgi:hypothetical protein